MSKSKPKSDECIVCASGGDMQSLYDDIGQKIADYGRHVIMVNEDPPFSYTTGNSIKSLPELLCIGLIGRSASMLNIWSEKMIEDGKGFEAGLVDFGDGSVPCKAIVPTPEEAAFIRNRYTILAGEFFGHQNYPIIIMVIPDTKGRFPGDPDCDPPYSEFLTIKE